MIWNKYKYHLIAFVSLVLILLLSVLYVYYTSQTMVFSPKGWKRIKIGMKKQDVIKILGNPRKVCEREEGKKKIKCGLESFGSSPEVDAKEALVYNTMEQVLYIFLDKDKRVVRFVVKGS